MKNFLFSSLLFLSLYFIISFPISLYQYSNRYLNFKIGECIFNDYSIIYDYSLYDHSLYKLSSNITVNNCTREINVCCSDYNYWNKTIEKNNTQCYYNQECDIIPDFIKNTTFNLFEISSFIFGILLALNIIVYRESKRKIMYLNYQEIN